MNAPNLPAWLQNDIPDPIGNTLSNNLGTGSVPYLSIMGNRLTLIDNAGDQEPITTVDPKTGLPFIDVCIIDVGPHPSKIYFGQAFDPNAAGYGPPKCWSDNGIAPSIHAGEPQARTCNPDPTNTTGCRHAVWGSATSKVTGKGIPACSKYQKLAFILPDDDMCFLLRVPPNSLENLRAYSKKFEGSGTNITQVVTRISFEQGVLGTLTFIGIGYADDKLTARKKELRAANATDSLVGRNDQPIAALPGVQQPAAVAAPQPSAYTPLPSPVTPSVPPAAPPAAAAPTGRRGRPPRAKPAETPVTSTNGPTPPFPTHGVVESAVAPDPGVMASLQQAFFKP